MQRDALAGIRLWLFLSGDRPFREPSSATAPHCLLSPACQPMPEHPHVGPPAEQNCRSDGTVPRAAAEDLDCTRPRLGKWAGTFPLRDGLATAGRDTHPGEVTHVPVRRAPRYLFEVSFHAATPWRRRPPACRCRTGQCLRLFSFMPMAAVSAFRRSWRLQHNSRPRREAERPAAPAGRLRGNPRRRRQAQPRGVDTDKRRRVPRRRPQAHGIHLCPQHRRHRPDFDIETPFKSAIPGRGYRIVNDPEGARFKLQAQVPSDSRMSITAAQAAPGAGYCGAFAGVAGAPTTGSSQGTAIGAVAGGIAETIANAVDRQGWLCTWATVPGVDPGATPASCRRRSGRGRALGSSPLQPSAPMAGGPTTAPVDASPAAIPVAASTSFCASCEPQADDCFSGAATRRSAAGCGRRWRRGP